MLAGDEEAFRVFFDRTFPGLFRFVLPRVDNNPDLAEEIVQSALTKAITKLSTYRGEAALFSWLCTFCRYEISAFFKQAGRVVGTVQLVEDLPEVRAALESLAADDDDPETATHRKEIGRLVRLTLDHLPSHYGDVLEWKYIRGMSVKEIAARLEVKPKAAESLLTRARSSFRNGFTAIVGSVPGTALKMVLP